MSDPTPQWQHDNEEGVALDEYAKDAMVKAGVPEDKVGWLLDMERMKNEELIPELQPYVIEEGPFGKSLKHPLVFSIPLTLPGQANMAYWQKKKAVDEAIEKSDWARVIWMHERPYRLEALVKYVVGWNEDTEEPIPLVFHNRQIRNLAAAVWADTENIHETIDTWKVLFSGWEPGDGLILAHSVEEREFNQLPNPLTVYRAGIDDGGWSWTLDPKVARFFAQRFGKNHAILVGKVEKRNVFGFLTRRGESEVLVKEGTVIDVRPFAVTGDDEDALT